MAPSLIAHLCRPLHAHMSCSVAPYCNYHATMAITQSDNVPIPFTMTMR